jgi:transglutaminase-like putative cysteine protease
MPMSITVTDPEDASRSDDEPTQLVIGCHFEFDSPADTHGVVIVEPHESELHRIIRETFDPPGSPARTYRDLFGNTCRRVTLPQGRSEMRYDAAVSTGGSADAVDPGATECPPSALPDDALVYLLPSRFCPSDELATTACELFGGVPPGWSRVEEISKWVNEHVTFGYGSSSPSKSASDVLGDGRGVCRDFAHLVIALCRALNLPARYVVGYLPDIGVPDPGTPMDFCAWAEVYLGDRWYTFDPRNHGQRRIGRTVIGRGRDAADVAMVTTFGQTTLLGMSVRAEAAPGT